jgi:hypothetical protein
MPATYRAAQNARKATPNGARLVGTASVKVLIAQRNARHARLLVVRPVLTNLPKNMTIWILA